MSATTTIRVPDLGDFDEVEVIEVLVKAGQHVAVDDDLITLETDKATMEVPSPHAGIITNVAVTVGDRVSQGSPIVDMSVSNADSGEAQDISKTDGSSDKTVAVAAVASSDAETVLMPQVAEIRVPNIGDFTEVEVIDVLVNEGTTIELDGPIVTLETDKATMDVPSTVAGKISKLQVSVGDRVSEGDLLALCETRDTATATVTIPGPGRARTHAQEQDFANTVVKDPHPSSGAAPAVLPPISEAAFKFAHASPAVRKFARELGVNLPSVKGTGLKNRITKTDVKAFVKSVMLGDHSSAAAKLPSVPVVDYTKFGDVEVKSLTRIQKISGPRLHASWINLPHVTHNDNCDFTDTDARRKKLKAQFLNRGVKLTPLAFILRACVLALEEMPLLNTSLSEDGASLVYKKYINLGFAADTPNGLVVPVIHNAQTMSIEQLAAQLAELSQLARDGKLKSTQMQGGTFTVSSLGGIGGTSFTPIINAPEVAILGVSRAQVQPVFVDGDFQPRLILPLSLSYDHRVIDGANAARFTALLARLLADPEGLEHE